MTGAGRPAPPGQPRPNNARRSMAFGMLSLHCGCFSECIHAAFSYLSTQPTRHHL